MPTTDKANGYGSLEKEDHREMRQIELEYLQHEKERDKHCRRHNISLYYSQCELAFQSENPLDSDTNSNYKNMMNIRWIGAALFVAASIFCLYEIWVLSNEKLPIVTSKLLMVNIFTRHGDRKFNHHFHLSSSIE